MREIKFRVWDNRHEIMMKLSEVNLYSTIDIISNVFKDSLNVMQYTGLKDKNGVEIYEYMEIDNTYEVSFLNGSYVLSNISNGDIILLSNYMENNNGNVEITREYTKV